MISVFTYDTSIIPYTITRQGKLLQLSLKALLSESTEPLQLIAPS